MNVTGNYSKRFVDVFPHGAKHSLAARPFSNPMGDPGGCRDYIPQVRFLKEFGDEIIQTGV